VLATSVSWFPKLPSPTSSPFGCRFTTELFVHRKSIYRNIPFILRLRQQSWLCQQSWLYCWTKAHFIKPYWFYTYSVTLLWHVRDLFTNLLNVQKFIYWFHVVFRKVHCFCQTFLHAFFIWFALAVCNLSSFHGGVELFNGEILICGFLSVGIWFIIQFIRQAKTVFSSISLNGLLFNVISPSPRKEKACFTLIVLATQSWNNCNSSMTVCTPGLWLRWLPEASFRLFCIISGRLHSLMHWGIFCRVRFAWLILLTF